MRRAILAVDVSALLTVFIVTDVVLADITAHTSSRMGIYHDEDDATACSWWNRGDFTIDTVAAASSDRDSAFATHGTDPTPKVDLESLPMTAPTMGPYDNGSGTNWAQSYAMTKDRAAWDRAVGTAHWSNQRLNEYHFHVESDGWLAPPGEPDEPLGVYFEGWATINDPLSFGWDAGNPGEVWTLSVYMILEEGSGLWIDAASGHANASLGGSSYLDFENDGTFDQLFWSLDVVLDANNQDISQEISLLLGPNVRIGGGKTIGQIESDLNLFWKDSRTFEVDSDYEILFEYDIPKESAGEMAYSLQLDSQASAAIPEPGTFIIWLLIGTLAVELGRHRRRRIA